MNHWTEPATQPLSIIFAKQELNLELIFSHKRYHKISNYINRMFLYQKKT